MRRLLSALRHEGGFTLLDLLITCTLFVTLTAIAADQLSSTVKHTSEIQEDNVVQTQVRGAVDQLVEDLRAASYGDTVTTPIEVATANQITFLSPDRQTPYHERRITYQLSSGKFQRSFSISSNTGSPPWSFPQMAPWTILFKNVTNSTVFGFQDATGTTTTNLAAIRRVTVTVTVNPPPNQGRQFTYQTSATLRATSG
jgi:type II secretory pathway pseudopilin PulG